MIIKIKNEELIQELIGKVEEFPLYTTQILNLANQNAQGTRPRVVGQLSELIKECPERTYEGWKRWYLMKNPEAIESASEKIKTMVNNLEEAIRKIDKPMIERWVEDLIIEKTFIGLRFQEAILKKVANIKKEKYRLSIIEEESKGIDGFIGDIPISIKPITYKIKNSLRENIEAKIIYYEKTKNGLNIDASELLN
jgi:hypothetical protein